MNTIGIAHNLDRARIRKLLAIGLFASVMTGIGDFLLGYADELPGVNFAASVMAGAPNLTDGQMIAGGLLGFFGVIVYGGWDGVQKGFTFGRFLARFLVILFGVKAFDIIALDFILITKTQFFQHYIPETKGCAGYHSFGYNRKEQLRQILALPFAALLTAWICTLF